MSILVRHKPIPKPVLEPFCLCRLSGRNGGQFSTDLNTTAMSNGILLTGEFWKATWNTLWIVGSAALGAGLLGLLVGYVVARTPVSLVGTFLRQVTFLPYLVPGIAFAAAYLTMFAVQRGPLPAPLRNADPAGSRDPCRSDAIRIARGYLCNDAAWQSA
ncbi:binding-protein-dependent transport systems inner membrane component [Brucella intermedia LMG 3301]|uniref:Binding-protein-dependent transport systems inner membrane component n=1 Tax=Brucella intermedia LMG 3301 TaxID=641118 RepID=C4WQQ0_9HYPH|nr:binding-protein-dependent transport systems inner membrane component [Brucella intermedia LMG 3301]